MKTVDNWLNFKSSPGAPQSTYNQAAGQWLGSVVPWGPWGARIGEPGGNRNYGATGERMGIPLEWLQRAAGLMEQMEPVMGHTGGPEGSRPAEGNVFSFMGKKPYGDHLQSFYDIESGYRAAKASDKGGR